MQLKDFESVLDGRKPKIMETKTESAVFIPLVEKGGQVYVLFEVRADELSNQPGEVCFPGGMMEKKEKPIDTARRETMEELCVAYHEIRILGPFDVLHNYTNVTIHTFVGIISEEVIRRNTFNKSEVKEIFLVPISFFLQTEPYVYHYEVVPDIREDFPYEMLDARDKYNWRRGECTVPIFKYEGHIIWGLTARILCHLLEEIKNG